MVSESISVRSAIRARIDLHDPRCTGVLASDQCCTVFARASAFAFGQHRCNALSFASAHDGIRCDARRAIRTWSSWIALSGYEWAHCITPGIRIDPVRIDSHLDYDELCLSARAWPRSALVGVVAKALPQHQRAVGACSVVLSALVIVCCLFLNAGARGDRGVADAQCWSGR